jgi:5-oxoprolinase (ATP-hydrolysing)
MQDHYRWEFWIDVGGTFTDCFAHTPEGHLLRHKLLSSGITPGRIGSDSDPRRIFDPARCADPAEFWVGYRIRIQEEVSGPFAERKIQRFDPIRGELYLDSPLPFQPKPGVRYELLAEEEAPVSAIRYLTGRTLQEPLPPSDIRLGTTRGTNALLTRTGAKTALVITQGFADVLLVGYQDRPHLFDLAICKQAPLYEAVIEIDERITAEGQILQIPDADTVREQFESIRRQGIEAIAICLLHAYRYPQHEQLLFQWAREAGFQNISVSSDVAPLMNIVARGDTTVVDAYLNPVLQQYIDRLQEKLSDTSRLRLLTSAGGLVESKAYRGKDSILSGPAGGVVGFAEVAVACGFDRAIGFDMGGTSTDTSRYDGTFPLEYETEKAGVRIVAPMMSIHTVAAGGGSVCWFDGIKPVVGPQSAGADPGPACYGHGGPLTVTDSNLLLGKIIPTRFPFPLDVAAAADRADQLAEEIRKTSGKHYQRLQLCEGFIKIANAKMAAAIREISIAQGADPRHYVLVAFGGAAAQHACGVARELHIEQILIHPDAGILSAYGIGRARIIRHAARGMYVSYDRAQMDEVEKTFVQLSNQARVEVVAEGVAEDLIEVVRSLQLRYHGTETTITILAPSDGDYAAAYHAAHQGRYGYARPGQPLEIVAARVEVAGRREEPESRSFKLPPAKPTLEEDLQDVYFDGKFYPTAIFDRARLKPGDHLSGPTILCSQTSTIVVDPGWNATVYSGGEIILEQQGKVTNQQRHEAHKSDPIMLEIFNNRFMAIARQMGVTLRNTASSVNVKQRLDFSCALFTATGELVANAPHVPVHLGAMGTTVRSILAKNQPLQPGDVYLTNDPYRGGSHLPDITVVTPVHDPTDGQLLFFTASRAHHAEIGGIRPGSMPPHSQNLAEEGVLLSNFKLFAAGQPQFDALRNRLTSAKFPSRNVADNLADVAAQNAANRQGAHDLLALVAEYSLPVVQLYMRHIQDAAAAKVHAALKRFPDDHYQFVDWLDVDKESAAIRVSIKIEAGTAEFDFSGTSPVLPNNLNANRAIVTAAVMYCLRCLIAEDIPLNEGVLSPVTIKLPDCLLNPPWHEDPQECAAVAAGNVETSQRIVDTILGALGVAAASQGTMNNLLFGDSDFGYYETLCGGAGATPAARGADAVQTHMTNTRLTDVEVLEDRYPVRVLQFAIRRGSGGRGQRRGGDGVVRRIQFLRPLEVSILSQRRGNHPPYGLEGGEAGALGINTLLRADGSRKKLPGSAQLTAEAGDVLIIETPGGGGYGKIDGDT